MRLDGAIFDLDGTLVDSMQMWDEAPKALVRRFGGTPSEDLPQVIKTMNLRDSAEYIIRTFHLDCTLGQLMDGLNDLVTDQYRHTVPMKPGADRLLARLAELGVPCGIATASEAFQAQATMERLGLWKYFRFAVSSSQYGSKTGPGIYLEAARRLGSAPERTLVFEDALHAAQCAKQTGFLVVGVYDPSAEEDQEALKQLCDWYLPRLDDKDFLHQLEI